MRAWGITDIGLQRSENQDTFAIEELPDGQIAAVVCDGMGGVNGGKLASTIAVETFLAQLKALLRSDMTAVQLREMASFAVAQANTAVYQRSCEQGDYQGMGTTLVCAVSHANGVIVCNVGDSRAYQIGQESITRITHDHSVVENLVERGNITEEEARNHPSRNLITRALGPEASIPCDAFEVPLDAGDLLLLCSDGLVVTASDDEILSIVRSTIDRTACLTELVALSKNRGAPDNVTAILLENG